MTPLSGLACLFADIVQVYILTPYHPVSFALSSLCVPPLPAFMTDAIDQLSSRVPCCLCSSAALTRWSWRLTFFQDHFAVWRTGHALSQDMAHDVLALSGMLWARMEVPMGSWPWRLLDGRESTADEFVATTTFRCCLDVQFSIPVLSAFPTPAAVRSDGFRSLVRELGRNLKTTNMALENLLAQAKSSCRVVKGHPGIESLHFSGLLSQAACTNESPSLLISCIVLRGS